MKGSAALKKIIPVFVFLLIGAFVLSYYFANEKEPRSLQRPETKKPIEEKGEGLKDDTVMDYVSKPRINSDTRLILKTLYTQCGNTVIDRHEINGSLVGLDKEGLLRHYPGWTVEKFEGEEVILSTKVEGPCPGHYVLRANNGYIAIYKIAEEGDEVFVENTDIPLSILRLRDQDRIRKGLLLGDIEEVNRYLEDFGS